MPQQKRLTHYNRPMGCIWHPENCSTSFNNQYDTNCDQIRICNGQNDYISSLKLHILDIIKFRLGGKSANICSCGIWQWTHSRLVLHFCAPASSAVESRQPSLSNVFQGAKCCCYTISLMAVRYPCKRGSLMTSVLVLSAACSVITVIVICGMWLLIHDQSLLKFGRVWVMTSQCLTCI